MDKLLFFAFNLVFFLSLAYYLMTNLQWYHYSLMRVLTKHHKMKWHFFYFVLPLIVFYLFEALQWMKAFYIGLFVIFIPSLIFWVRKLDKPLKWTGRVWRFFVIFLILASLDIALQFVYEIHPYFLLFDLFVALILSDIFEYCLFNRYKKIAQEKIASMNQLKIILITASYGKTSIKNYLTQILKTKYLTHCTPRSVNTLKGIVVDINTELDLRTQFYIVEAGARQKGDIAEIAQFLNPHFVIIGKIGPQHLEYFGSLEAIIETKFEALKSNNLRFALCESSNPVPDDAKKYIFKAPKNLSNICASLEKTTFSLEIDGEWHSFETPVLGSFNAYNIALCIEMARKMGMSVAEIKACVKKMRGVEHRLSKNEVNGKLILDDSFNGNLEGMQEAIRISSEYQGRKVIITPGVIEGNEELNIALAQSIDEVFDLAIITGELNCKILSEHIQGTQKIILKDKALMENTLKACTRDGDLILFANDAPSYI